MMNFSTDTYRPEALWTRWLVYWHTEMIPHLRRNWLSWGGLVGAILLFNAFFTLAITVTQSLPYHVFLVQAPSAGHRRHRDRIFRPAGSD